MAFGGYGYELIYRKTTSKPDIANRLYTMNSFDSICYVIFMYSIHACLSRTVNTQADNTCECALFIKYNGWYYCWRHRWFRDYTLFFLSHIEAWQRIFMLLSIVPPRFYKYYTRYSLYSSYKAHINTNMYDTLQLEAELNAFIFNVCALIRLFTFIKKC